MNNEDHAEAPNRDTVGAHGSDEVLVVNRFKRLVDVNDMWINDNYNLFSTTSPKMCAYSASGLQLFACQQISEKFAGPWLRRPPKTEVSLYILNIQSAYKDQSLKKRL